MKSLKAALNTPPEPGFDEASLADTSLPDSGSVVRHPDGYYWLAPDGHQQFGPFDSYSIVPAPANEAKPQLPLASVLIEYPFHLAEGWLVIIWLRIDLYTGNLRKLISPCNPYLM